jgi:hypothetical protein
VFFAFSVLALFRLYQFYDFRQKNVEILHVGHWAACLCRAVRLDPTLFQKHPILSQILHHVKGSLNFAEPSAELLDARRGLLAKAAMVRLAAKSQE